MNAAPREDGGWAFPWGEHGTRLGGLTVRDYFAAKALLGELASQNESTGFITPATYDALAVNCYAMADAMLKARSA